jgi:hypothetical protein
MTTYPRERKDCGAAPGESDDEKRRNAMKMAVFTKRSPITKLY